MQKDTLKRVAKVVAKVEKGIPLKDAIKTAKMSVGTYYKFKDRAANTALAPLKKKYKKREPTLETIMAPKHASKLAVVVGDTDSILEFVKGLN